jgi:hypothetical protein
LLEVKDLLAPCATIFALLFAAFAFLLPQALRLYRQTRVMLSKVEVPDSIKRDRRFIIGVHGPYMLVTSASIFSLFLGALFCGLLYRIIQYYLGSQAHSTNQILGDFSTLTLCVAVLASIIIIAAIVIMVNDIFVNEKHPTLVKIYTKDALNIRVTDKEVGSLLPEARKLFDQGKYLESILYSAAALEYAMSSKLGVSPQHGWRNLADIIVQKIGTANIEKLRMVGQIRNMAIHPTPNTSITEEEAREVLEVSSDLIKQLE